MTSILDIYPLRISVQLRKAAGCSLVLLIVLPFLASPVVGEWSEDTWLTNIIGPERLENGDEFGCHGYEGISISENNWVIEGCKEYLIDSTNASRWGKIPISFGIPGPTVDPLTASQLISSGFRIVGDMLDEPPEGMISAHRNGGSLEKGVADTALFESIDEDSLLSIYWRARIDDLRVREDKDAISWLERQDLWYTTWGEWNLHKSSSENTSLSVIGSEIHSFSESSDGAWSVPGTSLIQFDTDISGVFYANGDQYPVIPTESKKLQIGWRNVSGGILLTQSPGTNIIVQLSETPESVSIEPAITFNGHRNAVTIVGHHTTNLFHWSSDFQESPLTFTWLIERPSEEEIDWTLPVFAVATLIAVPIAVRRVVKSDRIDY